MPWRIYGVTVAVALAVCAVSLLVPALAFAHERRAVADRYQMVVGFVTEPAIAGESNGLDLRVTVPSESNRPVEGLEKSLKATVLVGGGARSMQLDLQPRFGQPGAYVAHFIPTREGSYLFQLTGAVEGVPIDERFESGPGRFNDVQSPQALEFPVRVPSGLDLADKVAAANRQATLAMLLGAGGLIVGLGGLITALVAIRSRANSRVAALGKETNPSSRREAA